MSRTRAWLLLVGLAAGLLCGVTTAQPEPKPKSASAAVGKDSQPPVPPSSKDPVPPPPPPDQTPPATRSLQDGALPVPKADRVKIKPLDPSPMPVTKPLTVTRPATEALAQIQTRLGQNPACDGIQITQARYEEVEDRLRLVVEGRLSEGRLRAVAENVCAKVMQESAAAADGTWPVPKLDQLPVVKPSPKAAAKAFDLGLQHYAKSVYQPARDAFAQAVAENPFDLSYKYWQVIAELALGHESVARRLLRPLVLRRQPAHSSSNRQEYQNVVRRLEPAQGLVRQKLTRLEQDLALEANTAR